MQLQSSIDWDKGITVQVLARHPYISTCFRWVHNLLEKEPTKLARYNYQPKPAGWGNGGGGLEPDDFEKLAKLFPDHPILVDGSLTEDQRLIIAGGIREFVHETGYKDIEIKTDYPGVFLYDYKYRDWVDKSGVIHPGGHRKITLWGEMTSFISYPDLHIEKHEVDRSDWFDLTTSLPKLFSNRFTHPDRPYWSHVRPTLIGILRTYRYFKSVDPYIPDIRDKIHSSWWNVFPVGRGDPRFPSNGYRLSPKEWYDLFDILVARKMEYADKDFLVTFLGRKLEDALRIEEMESKVSETVEPEASQTTNVVENSEDSEGIPTVKELRDQEDQEYAQWLEESLELPHSLRVTKPVA